jgi:hypothetical protein
MDKRLGNKAGGGKKERKSFVENCKFSDFTRWWKLNKPSLVR